MLVGHNDRMHPRMRPTSIGERRSGEAHFAIGTFLRDARSTIVAEWNADMGRLKGTYASSRPGFADALPALLDHIGRLAEHALSGAPLDETFESARRSAPSLLAGSIAPPPLVELSVLRRVIVSLWQRTLAARGDRELRAIDVAIDAVIAAAVARHEEVTCSRFEKVAEERTRALGKLESLLAGAPVGIAFLDRELRYRRINDALAAINGRPAAEHIGRSVGEMLPDAAPMLEPVLRDVMARGEPVLDLEIQRRGSTDGELRTYQATFFPVRAPSGETVGVGGIVTDVTEARRAQESLQLTQARMQAILEHTPAPIWIKDAEGRIVLANHRLADALGHPYEAILGRRSEELVPAELAAQHGANDELVASEQRAIEREEVVPGPDGPRTFLSIKFPLPGDPPMVGAIATDITERKRMEEELRLAIQARERVLAVVSHDLRNPLGTIKLAAGTVLGEGGPEQPWRTQHEIIQRSCLRMEHLIADLLDMARVGAGRLSVESKPELAEDITRDAAELHQPLADEVGVALRNCCEAEGLVVACDRQRVLQVFSNLIGNALKACRAGDVVTLGCEPAQEAVRFWVRDTGPGIAPELMPHLFEAYRTGDAGRGGIGLGLYIARGIVERHGGTLEVESTLGAGACFSFTIPAWAAQRG